jgi:purine-nucleoside phosphorylase
MAIRDHLNLQGRTPLGRAQAGYAAPYDFALRRALASGAQEAGFTLQEGVYAGLLGPTYETPAEIAMLRQLGADAVGMSTVAEVLAASAAGVRVGGVSLITNFAAGITGEKLSHEEVIAAGKEAAGRFSELLERAAALA